MRWFATSRRIIGLSFDVRTVHSALFSNVLSVDREKKLEKTVVFGFMEELPNHR